LHREKKDFKVATFAVLADARRGEEANPNYRKKAWSSFLFLFYGWSGEGAKPTLEFVYPSPTVESLLKSSLKPKTFHT
jgi:hypothetical protein